MSEANEMPTSGEQPQSPNPAQPQLPQSQQQQDSAAPASASQKPPAPYAPSVPVGTDQISQFVSSPKMKGFLGKSIKLMALFAVLGCALMWAAITALSTIITNALPH